MAAHCLPVLGGKALHLGGRDKWDRFVDTDHANRLWIIEEHEIYHVVQASLLHAWGLDCSSIVFLKFQLVHENARIDGALLMGGCQVTRKVLPRIRGALLCLQPDGYMLTAHQQLDAQITQLWRHSYGVSEDLLRFATRAWPNSIPPGPVSTTSRPAEGLQCALAVLRDLHAKASMEEAF